MRSVPQLFVGIDYHQGYVPKVWLAWVVNLAVLSEDDRWLMDQHLAELQHLTAQIKAVEKRLSDRVQDDPVVERLLTFEGVGFVTAVTLRAEIGYFDRFQTEGD